MIPHQCQSEHDLKDIHVRVLLCDNQHPDRSISDVTYYSWEIFFIPYSSIYLMKNTIGSRIDPSQMLVLKFWVLNSKQKPFLFYVVINYNFSVHAYRLGVEQRERQERYQKKVSAGSTSSCNNLRETRKKVSFNLSWLKRHKIRLIFFFCYYSHLLM